MVKHGNGVYWKGVAHDGPVLEPIAKAHEKVIEIAKGGKFIGSTVYEWVPLRKINSVPINKTAYRRIPRPNCLIMVGWPGSTHSPEKVDEARPLAQQIAACVAGGESKLREVTSQGYTNYGELLKFSSNGFEFLLWWG
jgi:hypothetical protein